MNIVYASRPFCAICKLHADLLREVHAAMWDVPADSVRIGPEMRTPKYREAAVRLLAARGITLEVKSVTRHASHVEKTGRVPSARTLNSGERPVFDISYDSMTDRAARIGLAAFGRLEEKIASDELEARELAVVAKTGMIAVSDREKLHQKDKQGDMMFRALMQFAGGFVQELPEEIIDGTSVEVLVADIAAERQKYLIHSGNVRNVTDDE